MTARVIVTGSRRWDDAARIEHVLKGIRDQDYFADAVLVHGAARGVDQMAAAAWISLGGTALPFRAKWAQCGRECPPNHQRARNGGRYCPTAGHRRNARMVDGGADLVLAFSRDQSAGCADCVRRAQGAGIPVLFFDWDLPADEGVWL
jgi:hypothetical protein